MSNNDDDDDDKFDGKLNKCSNPSEQRVVAICKVSG